MTRDDNIYKICNCDSKSYGKNEITHLAFCMDGSNYMFKMKTFE